MLLANNVVQLENESTNIYDQIRRYFERHANKSEQTRVAYENDVKQFFKVIKNKSINELSAEDVQLTLDDFEDFIYIMRNSLNSKNERSFSNKTINRKIAAVKGLVKYLAAKKIINDISYLDLIESLPEEKNTYGVFTVEEVFKMADLALEERELGLVKRYVLLFALDTCVRKASLLKLKWSDFTVRDEDVLVKGVDKGNKEFRESISKEFYKELLQLKNKESEYVFNISQRALDSSFKRLREKVVPNYKERNLTFHSIKKCGVTFRYRRSGGDILEAQKAAKHSRLDTTRLYLEDEEYGALGAVSSKGKINDDLFKEVDHETLIKAISNCNKNLQLILNIKIQEILNTK